MPDVLIRNFPAEDLALLDQHAARLGISRTVAGDPRARPSDHLVSQFHCRAVDTACESNVGQWQ
jgi:hypothetical protein